ncbi:MAG: SAM-dependent methyltransferase [Bacteroides sp.]|nr:SAM-dependent methyltransferase [Bacteroides sp.]
MTMTEDTLRFIREQRTADVRTLALQASRYPTVDMPVALTQIAGWQVAREKIPSWAATDDIRYPAHLSMEQCSSEATARYKSSIVKQASASCRHLTDLTGGFGIDCAFLAPCFEKTTYVERQETLCAIAHHNFPLLGLSHIAVEHDDAIRYLQEMEPVDWLFLDPARRDGYGGKTVAIGDCEPDVSALEELLLTKAHHVLVKLSPMLDLSLALQQLHHVAEAHIVSVCGECKELLLLLGADAPAMSDEVPIHCVNLQGNEVQQVCFTRSQESALPCSYTTQIGNYLYEPNASLLKGGAYHYLSNRYRVEKLHPNSHLYTADMYLPHFPGRRFKVESSCSFNKKDIKNMLGTIHKANLTVRNFPASVSDLRKRLKLSEGGEVYLFATTLADESKVLIYCSKVT